MIDSYRLHIVSKASPLDNLRKRIAELAPRVDVRALLALLIVLILWASAFAGIRLGLLGYDPYQVALLRYLTASVVLGGYALAVRMPLPELKDIPGIALNGFIGFSLYNVALNAGEQTVSAGVASFLIAAEVGVIALLAVLFLGERLRVMGWVGILLSFVGVGVISLAGEEGIEISLGALIILIATVCISVYTVLQKPYLRKYGSIRFVTYAMWAGTLFLMVFAPGLPEAVGAAPLKATLAVVYMGIFPGVLAYGAWSYVLSRIPASRAGSYLTVIPVMALAIAWLLLGEVPRLIAIGGGMLVLAGVVMVNMLGQHK